jgi:hypothetical protein
VLLGALLRLLTPINLRVHDEDLQPFAIIDFFQHVDYLYDNISEELNSQALQIRRYDFDALF